MTHMVTVGGSITILKHLYIYFVLIHITHDRITEHITSIHIEKHYYNHLHTRKIIIDISAIKGNTKTSNHNKIKIKTQDDKSINANNNRNKNAYNVNDKDRKNTITPEHQQQQQQYQQ